VDVTINMSIFLEIQGLVEKRFSDAIRTKRGGSEFSMSTTGALERSIKSFVRDSNGFQTIILEGLWYGKLLNTTFPAPINLQSKAGSNPGSPYIEGLTMWLMNKKGMGYKRAKKTAFAIANTKAGSNSKFGGTSTTPSNPGWIDEVKKNLDEEINEIIVLRTTQTVNERVDAVLNISI